jgi:formiminotetrahydrofolate cyclodeaminase
MSSFRNTWMKKTSRDKKSIKHTGLYITLGKKAPAQLTEIAEQFKQKDNEIQQLNKQIEELRADSEAFKKILEVFRDPEKLRQFEKLISQE